MTCKLLLISQVLPSNWDCYTLCYIKRRKGWQRATEQKSFSLLTNHSADLGSLRCPTPAPSQKKPGCVFFSGRYGSLIHLNLKPKSMLLRPIDLKRGLGHFMAVGDICQWQLARVVWWHFWVRRLCEYQLLGDIRWQRATAFIHGNCVKFQSFGMDFRKSSSLAEIQEKGNTEQTRGT